MLRHIVTHCNLLSQWKRQPRKNKEKKNRKEVAPCNQIANVIAEWFRNLQCVAVDLRMLQRIVACCSVLNIVIGGIGLSDTAVCCNTLNWVASGADNLVSEINTCLMMSRWVETYCSVLRHTIICHETPTCNTWDMRHKSFAKRIKIKTGVLDITFISVIGILFTCVINASFIGTSLTGFIDTSSLDERGSDMRGCDKRGNNERVSYERKSDKRGSDERRSDERGSDERWNNERGSDERGSDERGRDERGSDDRENDERGSDERGSDDKERRCNMLQGIAVCCIMLWVIAMGVSASQCDAACCYELLCVAVCGGVLPFGASVAGSRESGKRGAERHSVYKHVAAHCNVLRYWMLQPKKKNQD